MKRLSLLTLLLLAGCGPGVAEGPLTLSKPDSGADGDSDADTDTDTDSDTDSDTDPVFCPGEIDPVCTNVEYLQLPEVIINANDVAAGLQFVDMDYNTLLATDPDDSQPLLVMFDFGGESPLTTYSTAIPSASMPAELTSVGVVASGDPIAGLGFSRMALLSDSGALALYGANLGGPGDTAEFVEIDGSQLTPTQLPRGVVYLANKTQSEDPWFDRICLFGDGIYCFDGTGWQEEIAAGTGSQFNELSVLTTGSGPALMAVGDGGRIAFRAGGGWQEPTPPTAEDLLTVSVHDERFVAAGRNGIFVEGDIDAITECETDDDDVIAINFPSEIFTDHFMGMVSSGQLILGHLSPDIDGWICRGEGTFEGAFEGRYISSDYYVLTPDTLHGQPEDGLVVE